MKLRTLVATLALLVIAPLVAQGQVVVAPTQATFAHPDADFNDTLAYHFDFFSCSSVTTAGVCVGKAAAPIQAGFDIPKGSVTGNAAARIVSLTAAPASGFLASVPVGTGIVATVVAIGDTSIPGVAGQSAASAPSNGFFVRARTPAAPGSLAVKP